MGTAKINYCLLMGYNIVLALVVVTEIGLSISLFVLAKNGLFKNVLEDKLIHSLEHFNQDGYPGVTKGMYLSTYLRRLFTQMNISQCFRYISIIRKCNYVFKRSFVLHLPFP